MRRWPTDTDFVPSLPDGLLLECLITTRGTDGAVHTAPMGPIFDAAFERALLRPYPPSQTLENLRRDGVGVLHVTDDAALIARCAVGLMEEAPPTEPTPDGRGAILQDACAWRQVEVESLDDRPQPARVVCRVTQSGSLRDFVGFNRARHAVIEAAILATRLDFLPRDQVRAQLDALAAPIEKTGGHAERDAYAMLVAFVRQRTGEASP